METLLNIARALREWLYALTTLTVLGIEFDVVLHFVFGAAIFALAHRRFGARRATGLLAAAILAKEVADIFLKSQLRYIKAPPPDMLLDIVIDVMTGVLGGLAVWLWLRRRRARETTATVP